MKKYCLMSLVCLMGLLSLAGCNEKSETAQEKSADYQSWIGKWMGPEGTYLVLEQGADTMSYKVVIANLDGPRTFIGAGKEKGILFERDGVNETIFHGTGPETGMKWLMDKKDCLVVKIGEGFCRD